MVASDTLFRLIDNMVQRTYGGPLRRASRRIGIEDEMQSSYNTVLSYLVPSERIIKAGDTELRFRIEGVDEYKLFQYYPETKRSYPVLADILTQLRTNDVFWDVGANAGIYTCFAAAELPHGNVVSIEPNPNNTERIEENLANNNLSANVLQHGLADRPGEFTLDISKPDTAGSFGSITADKQSGVPVEVATGEQLIERGVPEPNVVKIDVEGGERNVLRGMERCISRGECRTVYCNVQGRGTEFQSIVDDVSSMLQGFNFEIKSLWEWEYKPIKGRYIRARRR